MQGTNPLGDQIRPHHPMGPGGMHEMHGMGMHNYMDGSDPNMDMVGGPERRTYRKKKTWALNLNITIETPELENKHNETF